MIFSNTLDNEMKWRILAEVGAITQHKRERLSWILPRRKDNKPLIEMISEYYEVSNASAREIIESSEEADLIEFLSFYGYNESEAKKILKG